MQKFKLSILIVGLFGLLTACKKEGKNTTEKVDPRVAINTDFDDFFKKFHEDTAYQMNHIVWPLEGRPSLKDENDSIPIGFKWQKNNWILHRPFNDMNGTFDQEFFSIENMVIEKTSDQSGQFKMERRFAKLSDGWHLIYYKEMGL